MAFKCPVPGCEDSEKEFQTETALKSYIRNIHPEFMEDESTAREVPIVEEDFATLLRKFKIKGDLTANIAENISHTGGPRAFEDAEILLKRLSLWSSDIPPAKRKLIIEQWFAERGVDIPPEIQKRAGMTSEQIRETEKKTKEEGEVEVRYIYDTDVKQVRMAKEGERGGTLSQAKELKKMAEESKAGTESPFVQDGEGNWMLNPQCASRSSESPPAKRSPTRLLRRSAIVSSSALLTLTPCLRVRESWSGPDASSALLSSVTSPPPASVDSIHSIN
jgi:hypothetical protein